MGVKYIELDEINAQIAEMTYRQDLGNEEAKTKAEEARHKVDQMKDEFETAEKVDDTGKTPQKPQELKDKFGDRLSFFGAIDQQYLLPNGSPEEIETDVKEKMEILGRGGGYIVAPAHIIQADTSLENVEAFINAVKKYGTYE